MRSNDLELDQKRVHNVHQRVRQITLNRIFNCFRPDFVGFLCDTLSFFFWSATRFPSFSQAREDDRSLIPSVNTVRLSRLVLSCLRLVFGHRQLKQVWDATDTPATLHELLPSPETKMQDEFTWGAQSPWRFHAY